jgi:hypothetical protein
MTYLCLIHLDEKKLYALPPDEMAALTDEALDYDEVLRASGHYITSDALQPVETATTIRDGPFAETKEQLGGFMLIEGTPGLRRGAADPIVDALVTAGPDR